MSKVFYDSKLESLEKIEKEIAKLANTKEEKEELTRIVDEYVHHRIIGCILSKLPQEHHEHFLTQFSEAPHHDGLWDYLKEKIPHDVEEFIKDEVEQITLELLKTFKGKK